MNSKKRITLIAGAALGATMGATTVQADVNPFAIAALESGYMVAAAKAAEGKCGSNKTVEAKCGSNTAMEETKTGEAKCGGNKAAAKPIVEAKCGEAKCGSNK